LILIIDATVIPTATYKMGAHLVVHSATKLDGQGRVLSGTVA
jgi:cystathionine beta-lyase/cystathionine gamma-synthase